MRSLRFTPFGGGVGYHAEKDFLTACQIDERVSDSISMPTDSSSSQCATEREKEMGAVCSARSGQVSERQFGRAWLHLAKIMINRFANE